MLANHTALISKMFSVSTLVIEQGQSSGAINNQKGMKDLHTMLHLYRHLYHTIQFNLFSVVSIPYEAMLAFPINNTLQNFALLESKKPYERTPPRRRFSISSLTRLL